MGETTRISAGRGGSGNSSRRSPGVAGSPGFETEGGGGVPGPAPAVDPVEALRQQSGQGLPLGVEGVEQVVRGAAQDLELAHAGGEPAVLRVGLVLRREHHHRGGGDALVTAGGLGQGPPGQPDLEEGHEAVHVLGAGHHLVHAPARHPGRGGAFRVPQLGLAEPLQDLGQARDLEDGDGSPLPLPDGEQPAEAGHVAQNPGGPGLPLEARGEVLAAAEDLGGGAGDLVVVLGRHAELAQLLGAAEGEDELEEQAVLGHAVAAVALAGRMDDAVAPAAHLVAHLLDVAVAAGRDHEGQGVGEGEVRGHAGVLAGLQDLGLGEAVVAAHGLVDQPVDLPSGPRRGAVGAADPLRPGLHRLPLPVAEVDPARGVQQVIALVAPGGSVAVGRIEAQVGQAVAQQHLLAGRRLRQPREPAQVGTPAVVAIGAGFAGPLGQQPAPGQEPGEALQVLSVVLVPFHDAHQGGRPRQGRLGGAQGGHLLLELTAVARRHPVQGLAGQLLVPGLAQPPDFGGIGDIAGLALAAAFLRQLDQGAQDGDLLLHRAVAADDARHGRALVEILLGGGLLHLDPDPQLAHHPLPEGAEPPAVEGPSFVDLGLEPARGHHVVQGHRLLEPGADVAVGHPRRLGGQHVQHRQRTAGLEGPPVEGPGAGRADLGLEIDEARPGLLPGAGQRIGESRAGLVRPLEQQGAQGLEGLLLLALDAAPQIGGALPGQARHQPGGAGDLLGRVARRGAGPVEGGGLVPARAGLPEQEPARRGQVLGVGHVAQVRGPVVGHLLAEGLLHAVDVDHRARRLDAFVVDQDLLLYEQGDGLDPVVGDLQPAVVGAGVEAVAGEAHELGEVVGLAQVGLLELVDLHQQVRAGGGGALADDDVGGVSRRGPQQLAAHPLDQAEAPADEAAHRIDVEGGLRGAGQLIAVVLHPGAGPAQSLHEVVPLRVEDGFLVALAGPLQLDQGDRLVRLQQQAQLQGRRLQSGGPGGGRPGLPGQRLPGRRRRQAHGVGEERALVVEGAAHAAEDQLLSRGPGLAGEAADVLRLDLAVVVAQHAVEQQALGVHVGVAVEDLAGGPAVVGQVETILAEEPGDPPVAAVRGLFAARPPQEDGEQVAGVELSRALEQGQEHGLVRASETAVEVDDPVQGPAQRGTLDDVELGEQPEGEEELDAAQPLGHLGAQIVLGLQADPEGGHGVGGQPQPPAVEIEEALVAPAQDQGPVGAAQACGQLGQAGVALEAPGDQARGAFAQPGRQRRLGSGVVGDGHGRVGKGAGAEGQGPAGQDLPGAPPGAADPRGPVVVDEPEGKALGVQSRGHGKGRGLILGLQEAGRRSGRREGSGDC